MDNNLNSLLWDALVERKILEDLENPMGVLNKAIFIASTKQYICSVLLKYGISKEEEVLHSLIDFLDVKKEFFEYVSLGEVIKKAVEFISEMDGRMAVVNRFDGFIKVWIEKNTLEKSVGELEGSASTIKI